MVESRAGSQVEHRAVDLEQRGVGARERQRVGAELVIGDDDVGDLDAGGRRGALGEARQGVGEHDGRRRLVEPAADVRATAHGDVAILEPQALDPGNRVLVAGGVGPGDGRTVKDVVGESIVGEGSRQRQHVEAHARTPVEYAAGDEPLDDKRVAPRAARELEYGVDARAHLEDVIAVAAIGDDLCHARERQRTAEGLHCDGACNRSARAVEHSGDPERFIDDAAVPVAVGITVSQGIVAGGEGEHALLEPRDHRLGPARATAPRPLPFDRHRDRHARDRKPRAERCPVGAERDVGPEARPCTRREVEIVRRRGVEAAGERLGARGIAGERQGECAVDRHAGEGEVEITPGVDQEGAGRAIEPGDADRRHVEEVERALIDADFPYVGLLEEAAADVDLEEADVNLRCEPHVEVGVGLHDGAAVERHVGRPRVDEHRTVDAGDVADAAACPALEDEIRLAALAVEDPGFATHAERPEAHIDRAHETRPDPARVKHEARRPVERHAAGRQLPVAGDSHRVRRHAAEHVAVAVVVRLAGPADRPHLPLDRARVDLEEHGGIERQHARHADDGAADGARFEATEQAAVRACHVCQRPGDPQRFEHREVERGVE